MAGIAWHLDMRRGNPRRKCATTAVAVEFMVAVRDIIVIVVAMTKIMMLTTGWLFKL